MRFSVPDLKIHLAGVDDKVARHAGRNVVCLLIDNHGFQMVWHGRFNERTAFSVATARLLRGIGLRICRSRLNAKGKDTRYGG